MIDRQSLLAQLLMGPPQPATRLSQLAGAPADPVDAMRANLPPMATPDTRAGRPNRLAELTMPSAEFEPAVRPFGSPHVPAVTTPSEERRLVDLAMMLSSFVGNLRAFHGSPHRFDRFDMQKIGTGEGAQAYGHGLYFAENPATAQTYRDAAVMAKLVTKDGQTLMERAGGQGGGRYMSPWLTTEDQAAKRAGRVMMQVMASNGNWDDAIQTLPDALRPLANNMRASGVRYVPETTGSMYEVNLRTTPDRLLDWDKPLSQQPEAVRQAWDSITEFNSRVRDAVRSMPEEARGRHLYAAIQDTVPHQRGDMYAGNPAGARFAAEEFRDAGLHGIQYLDQGSRATGEGTRNFVMFRDDIIDILRRYGLAAGLLGGSAATADAAP